MERPDPPFEAPKGFAWEPVASVEWRLVSKPRRCRYAVGYLRRGCGKQAVAERDRGRTGQAWGYCAARLYGGWVENGRVTRWRLVSAS